MADRVKNTANHVKSGAKRNTANGTLRVFRPQSHGNYKKLYRIGKAGDEASCQTDANFTKKSITPMGGFVQDGEVKQYWIMLKGAIGGVKKRPLILRKS